MKRWLLLIIFLLLTTQTNAQDTSMEVVQRLSITSPEGYYNTYSSIIWSPDNEKFAVNFELVSDGANFRHHLWQIYDIASGTLLQSFGDFVSWYSDSRRALVYATHDSPPSVVDVVSGEVIFTLEDAGSAFHDVDIYQRLPTAIDDRILSGDSEQHYFHIYDAENGNLLFTRENVSYNTTYYSPDRTRFVLNMLDESVEIYDAQTFILIETLTAAHAEYWGPDGRQLIFTPLVSHNRYLAARQLWTEGIGVSAPIYNITGNMIWSADGSRIALPSDYTKIRIYDAVTGELLQTILGFDNVQVNITEWDGDLLIGYLGTYLDDGFELFIWDFAQNEFIYRDYIDLGNHYSINGNVLEIFEGYFGIRHIDLSTGETIFELDFDFAADLFLDERWVIDNGTTFIEDDPITTTIYSVDPFEVVATLEGHVKILNVRVSPNAHYLATIGDPELIIVWELIYED